MSSEGLALLQQFDCADHGVGWSFGRRLSDLSIVRSIGFLVQACVVVFTTLPTPARTPAVSGLVSGGSAVKA